jgi:hypothetical protein
MFSFFSSVELSSADAARLRRIERKLDLIIQHLAIETGETTAMPDEARRLADKGQKVQAIKAYREATGADLREAKEAIEAYIHRQ